MFSSTFLEKVWADFERTPRAVVHLDQVRNTDTAYYPFNYPTIEQVLGRGVQNWHGHTTRGLDNHRDMIHGANYGACMAAPRAEVLAAGGADEHLDYLGYLCGPYDLTFRLGNAGLPEHWLRDEYLYHTWHPNIGLLNTDFKGPTDGLDMSMRALEARAMGRIEPYLENPWIAEARRGVALTAHDLAQRVRDTEEHTWRIGQQPDHADAAFCLEKDYHGFNLYICRGRWYGIPQAEGRFDYRRMAEYRPLLQGDNPWKVKALVDYYRRLPSGFWARLWNQPLYQLPARAALKIGRELKRAWHAASPSARRE